MPSPSISLERIDVHAWKLWRELRLEALREAPDAFGSTLAQWLDAPESRWIQRLESVPFNLIARLFGEPAGIVSCIEPRDGGVAELISLWVAPFARGRGVADTLIQAVIAWAAEQNASGVMLAVRANNTRAIELYRRNAFADAGPHPDPESACELVMIRYLN
jgi:ribosomal protein S18 acetylase RimI-like enzyme